MAHQVAVVQGAVWMPDSKESIEFSKGMQRWGTEVVFKRAQTAHEHVAKRCLAVVFVRLVLYILDKTESRTVCQGGCQCDA
jgi:hypothetical protein